MKNNIKNRNKTNNKTKTSKTLLLSAMFLAVSNFAVAGECEDLSKKYNAPDPATKTMNQIERWVKRSVSDAADAQKLQDCLVKSAADNPNKATVAGS